MGSKEVCICQSLKDLLAQRSAIWSWFHAFFSMRIRSENRNTKRISLLNSNGSEPNHVHYFQTTMSFSFDLDTFLWLFLSYPDLHLYLWKLSPFFICRWKWRAKGNETIVVFKTPTGRVKVIPEDTISSIVMSQFSHHLGSFNYLNKDLSAL